MTDFAVKIEKASKFYKLYASPKDRLKEALNPFGKKWHREFYALNNINLEVQKGEILGIVGRNGSGKSTLLKLISGVIQPNSGELKINGSISTLLDLGAGLNPDFDGIQNIYFGGIMMGFSREEMKQKIDGIIDFAGIGDFIHQPLKTYSSGMKTRLGFALAISVNPEILVIDEVLAVGDELFKRKCYARMTEMFNSGCTVFFVSQSPNQIAELCTRGIIIDAGEIIFDGTPKQTAINYEKFLFAEPSNVQTYRDELLQIYHEKESQRNQMATIEPIPVILEPQSQPCPDPVESTLLMTDDSVIIPQPIHRHFCVHESLYLDEFQTQSRVTHKTADIDLVNLHISTLKGEKVNYLIPNEWYYVTYEIRFGEAAECIAVTCVFKSEKGIVLSGIKHPGVGQSMNISKPNSTYRVKWKFRCGFLPGNYYLDIGVISFKDAQKHVLSAEYDALVFKVQSCKCLKEPIANWSYFSVSPEIELKLL